MLGQILREQLGVRRSLVRRIVCLRNHVVDVSALFNELFGLGELGKAVMRRGTTFQTSLHRA